MQITLLQAFLVGVVYYMGFVGTPWLIGCLGSLSTIQKPLVAGVLVGVILGDPVQGCIIGAAVQMPFIAYIFAGGAQPNDPGLAGTLGVALALAAGLEPDAAVAISVPIALVGTIVNVIRMTFDVSFVHMIDRACERGDMKRAVFLHIVPPQILCFILCVVPVTLGCYYGVDAVTSMINVMQGRPLYTLEVIGGILPALGIAMNLRTLDRPGTLLWFVFGFVLSSYLGLGSMPVAIIGFIIAFFYVQLEMKAEEDRSLTEVPKQIVTSASTSSVASEDSDDDFK
ncbi:PTS sugar transporter subunit IIC [Atopobium sp. oral taxon 416]|jgi:mannose/fructose/N-acetylgalactosamine-specific phosphotransferase system component IIC|uniref:PTS mannose/fructose/sorbose/N-acetylgalactosamine transporter subunit IIC n=1 Tax=Atopobium sp. oral taxon 416 TaxID=712157 RepID=UPI001BADFF0E|nr:PTS sugar transporter subunit IIC [Atopobium sp. oral taxon 416]QUC03729.1 PTS sugar transporter subunit IIC [Atopobium sp. oral taxon 416]